MKSLLKGACFEEIIKDEINNEIKRNDELLREKYK